MTVCDGEPGKRAAAKREPVYTGTAKAVGERPGWVLSPAGDRLAEEVNRAWRLDQRSDFRKAVDHGPSASADCIVSNTGR
jgi:hypothetical protein